MKRSVFFFFFLGLGVGNVHAGTSGPLSLPAFLEDVRTRNPEARATMENINSFELRVHESEAILSPEAYAQGSFFDDKKPTPQPIFLGSETRGERWRAGIRKQTDFGLGADLYFNSQHTVVVGASPVYLNPPDYVESSAVLQLTQSIWRNGFGEATHSQMDVNRAANEINLLQAKFRLKTLMLTAQNAYWSLVSFNQIVKLQEENVARAQKLRDYMKNRTRLRLFDDTDAMQAQAAFETRELELQSSLDDRAAVIRKLNTLRGLNSDEVQNLDELPGREMMEEVAKNPEGRMTREDYELLRAQAKAGLAQARLAKSQIQPQLDLAASVATNGRDSSTGTAYEQTQTNHYPTWSIGFNFSIPLDVSLIRDIKRSYNAAGLAAKAVDEQAGFSEIRAWDDLLKQKTEAKGRYNRSLSVEKIQTELVKRERQRLLNGRATTFEALNFEQNLALAQIQRVRSQLVLLQIHNALKTFEAKP